MCITSHTSLFLGLIVLDTHSAVENPLSLSSSSHALCNMQPFADHAGPTILSSCFFFIHSVSLCSIRCSPRLIGMHHRC